MGVDTSIYQNLLRPPKSVAEYDQEAMAGEQNKLMMLMQRQKADEYTRGIADEQAQRAAVAGFGSDKNANLNMLYKTGNLKAAQGYEKSNADISKVQADAEKEHLIAVKDRLALLNNAIAGSVDQNSYSLNRQSLAQQGVDISGIPEQFDPAFIANAKQQAMTELQRADQVWKQKGFDLDVRQQGEVERNNRVQAADRDATRAQSDRHHREGQANSMSKPFEVTGPDGTPVLVRQDKQGNIAPVEGYSPKSAIKKPLPPGVVKTLTEARDNATTMDRMSTDFKPEYGGKGVFGLGADMSMAVKGNLGTDQKATAFWKDYRKNAELVERHAMFGASLTPGEQASWRSADIAPGMNPEVIKTNLATRAALTKKVAAAAADDMVDAGHNEQRVRAIAGRGEGKPAASALPPDIDALLKKHGKK